MAEKPTAAFVLSLIGGIFILLGGAFIAAVAGILSGLFAMAGFGDFGLGLTMVGVLGILIGLIIIVGGVMMYMKPQQHVVWGVLVLILALVSIPFSVAGGFVIGFILALIGGILGLVFKPSMPMAAPYAPPMAPPPQ